MGLLFEFPWLHLNFLNDSIGKIFIFNQKMDLSYNNLWKSEAYLWRREVSEKYNYNWIKYFGLKFFENVSLKEFSEQNLEVKYSGSFQVVWLRNIDRLMDMMPVEINIRNYNLIDVGCGSGISTLYFLEYYPFKSFHGFDFSEDLITKAEINLKLYLLKSKSKKFIDFKVNNAKNIILEDQKNLLFMFHPFEFPIAREFILNNLHNLKKNNSIIAFSNDFYIKKIIDLNKHRKLIRDPFNNLSLILF